MPDAERVLWRSLRGKQVLGYRFRRQHPMGKYIVDFICLERKLITEVDGRQHAETEEADAVRTAWLQSVGYRVIRFWSNDVMRNTPAVLRSIVAALDTPTPPSPSRGEGPQDGAPRQESG
jgi:adenine-specific DNA-methyltransferase